MEVTKNPVRWPEYRGYDDIKRTRMLQGFKSQLPKSEKAGHLDDSSFQVSKEFQESRSSQHPTFRSTFRDLNVHRLIAS